MCGIFGFSGSIDAKNKNIFFKLLSNLTVASEVRGRDATGFAARFEDGSLTADKLPVNANQFIQMSQKFTSLKYKMPLSFIGHTRLGTGGSHIINNNNHPFFGDYFIMVHNGVIPSWRLERSKHKLEMTSETDSEIILRLFEKIYSSGSHMSNTTKRLLETLNGNMAVALLDRDTPDIWLFRNDNPINVSTIDESVFGEQILMFSSTESIFNNAWKETFGKAPSEEEAVTQSLDDNILFLITSNARDISGEKHRFIRYNIRVEKKFSKSTQYTSSWSGTKVNNYGYPTSSRNRYFWTDIRNPSKPWEPPVFNLDTARELSDFAANDKNKPFIIIDGMPLGKFIRMKALLKRILKIEEDERIKSDNKESIVQ